MIEEIKEAPVVKGELAKKISEDEFLSVQCNFDDIERFLNHVSKSQDSLFTEFESEIVALSDEGQKRFQRLKVEISSARDELKEQFAILENRQTVDKYVLKAAISRIDRLFNRLSRMVRPSLEKALKPFSPSQHLVESFVKRLFSRYNQICTDAPDDISVVIDYYTLKPISGGQTIYQAFISDFRKTFIDEYGQHLRLKEFNKIRHRLKSRLRILNVPIARLVTHHYLDLSDNTTERLATSHATIHEKLFEELSDIWRSIRFNLEEVLAELDNILDASLDMTLDEMSEKLIEPEQLAMESLNKALVSFDGIFESYTNFLNDIVGQLREDSEYSFGELKKQIERILTLKENPNQYDRNIRYHTAFWWTQFNGKIRRNLSDFTNVQRDFWSFAQSGLFSKWQKIRARHVEQESLLRLTELPTTAEISAVSKNLPSIYRRLFSQKPLLNRDLVVWREDEIGRFVEVYQRWLNGNETSIAIIGQEGTGKKTLLNVLEGEVDEQITVTRLTISERLRSQADVIRILKNHFGLQDIADNLDDLVKELQQLPRQVVFVEGAFNLLFRSIGLRKAPYAFLYILLATRKQFMWVMTFKKYPWLRLSYLFDITRYFTHKMEIDFHNEREIRDAMSLRQRSSQYPMFFSDQGIETGQIRNAIVRYGVEAQEAQDVLADLYFKELFEISGGNMKAALYYWLYSAKYDSLNKRIVISPCVHIDSKFILELDKLYLFTLGEIVSHGEMTVNEHAEIFNVNAFVSRGRLEYLRHIRLLEATRFGRNQLPSAYAVNPVFYLPVVTALNAQHLLY